MNNPPSTIWEVISSIGTLIAAIGTIGAFIVAFIQISIERKARLKKEQQERNIKHRAQAELISSWISNEDLTKANISIMNNSHAPVYHLIVNIVSDGSSKGAGKKTMEDYRAKVRVIPPGISETKVSVFYHGMSYQSAIEVAFTDSFGNHWVRDGCGKLDEIDVSPEMYYGISLPADWE